jgi:hypothetical protein
MNHLMDTFHALFCYCYDPTHGYGHYYPYITVKLSNQRTTVKNIPYSNTFSSNLENSKKDNEFNIESVMVELILKPLIDRLIEIKNEMTNQENLVNSIFLNL